MGGIRRTNGIDSAPYLSTIIYKLASQGLTCISRRETRSSADEITLIHWPVFRSEISYLEVPQGLISHHHYLIRIFDGKAK